MTVKPLIPQRFTNYPGDLRHAFLIGSRRGPTTSLEPVYVYSVEYDKETDRTRVGYGFIAPTQEQREQAQAQINTYGGDS